MTETLEACKKFAGLPPDAPQWHAPTGERYLAQRATLENADIVVVQDIGCRLLCIVTEEVRVPGNRPYPTVFCGRPADPAMEIPQLTHLPNIVVERYDDNGYRAMVRGNPARWGYGVSVAEAVGDLVISFGLDLGQGENNG